MNTLHEHGKLGKEVLTSEAAQAYSDWLLVHPGHDTIEELDACYGWSGQANALWNALSNEERNYFRKLANMRLLKPEEDIQV